MNHREERGLILALLLGTVFGSLLVCVREEWFWLHYSEIPAVLCRGDGPSDVSGLLRLGLWRGLLFFFPVWCGKGKRRFFMALGWTAGISALSAVWLSLFTMYYRAAGAVRFLRTVLPQFLFYGAGVGFSLQSGKKEQFHQVMGSFLILFGIFLEIMFDFLSWYRL